MFDGVHKGHQAIIDTMKQLTPKGKRYAVTFTNHPVTYFTKTPIQLLIPLEERITRLKSFGITDVITLPFTKEIAEQPYDTFLQTLRNNYPFDHLVLGEDAVLGKGRAGTKEIITAYAMKHGFTAHYIPKVRLNGQIVSSTTIRNLLEQNDTELAHQMLGTT